LPSETEYFQRISSTLVLRAHDPDHIELAEGDQVITLNLQELKLLMQCYTDLKHWADEGSNKQESREEVGTGYDYFMRLVNWILGRKPQG